MLGKINAQEMYMHITPQDGSSSTKKKDLAFKASQEKRGKAKVDHDSSSDDEIDDASLALMVRRTSKMLKKLNTHPTKAYMSTTRVLELVHMDLFGPTTYKSLGGNLYYLMIVDDYSRYTWVFFLHDKTEVAACFKKFAKRAQNEFQVKLKKMLKLGSSMRSLQSTILNKIVL